MPLNYFFGETPPDGSFCPIVGFLIIYLLLFYVFNALLVAVVSLTIFFYKTTLPYPPPPINPQKELHGAQPAVLNSSAMTPQVPPTVPCSYYL